MKVTIEERFRRKLLKIGKKNKFCRVCIIPVLAVGMFFLHGASYCRGNVKRFAMLAMTFLFFAVYSSFSFPAFILGNGSDASFQPVSEEAMDIELAKEQDLDPADFVLLDDSDVQLEGEEYTETSHGMDLNDRYSADQLLDSAVTYSGAVREEQQNEEQQNEEQQNEEQEEQEEEEIVFSRDDWRLVLINQQHSIPDDYELTLGSISTLKGSLQCDERIIDELLTMLSDAKKDGIELAILSPYRDTEYQKMLFNRKITRYMKRGMSYMEAYQLASQAVTVPGASEHQIGLALDIVKDIYTSLDESFGETKEGIWLAGNSYKYGFILRYPAGKEDITGIEYEPWHFRYVGVDAATVITEEGITLEEFWEDYL
jgi:D-alanyl-D-alanine carboxypeptidase